MKRSEKTVPLPPIDEVQDGQFGHLRLNPQIEALYRTEKLENEFKSVSRGWFVGLCLYDSFIVSDFFVSPRSAWMYALGRFGIVTPICLVSIFLMSSNHRFYRFLNSLIPLVFTVNLSVLLILSEGIYRSNYLFGDILLMMCGCVIGRPLLNHALITVVLQFACYLAVLRLSDVVGPESVIVSALFCFSGGVVALLTVYGMEQIGRHSFLLSLRVRMLNRSLETMAMTDPLTGLANRRSFDEATKRFWAGTVNKDSWASMILIDVDFFKLFNDNYGHSAGDICLNTLAKCVASVTRDKNDLAVRFGGEELIVFLPNTAYAEAQQLAEAIRLAIIAAGVPHPVIARDGVVTASLGVATALTSRCKPDDLVALADASLYAAKQNGRNRVWPPVTESDMTWNYMAREVRSQMLYQ